MLATSMLTTTASIGFATEQSMQSWDAKGGAAGAVSSASADASETSEAGTKADGDKPGTTDSIEADATVPNANKTDMNRTDPNSTDSNKSDAPSSDANTAGESGATAGAATGAGAAEAATDKTDSGQIESQMVSQPAKSGVAPAAQADTNNPDNPTDPTKSTEPNATEPDTPTDPAQPTDPSQPVQPEFKSYKLTINGVDSNNKTKLKGTCNGKTVKSVYLEVARIVENSKVKYIVLDPRADNSKYTKAAKRVYYFNQYGDGTLWENTGIIKLTFEDITGIHTKNVYVEAGKINEGGEVTSYVVWNGYLYRISTTGVASKRIKDATRTGKYTMLVGETLYRVTYQTGFVTKHTNIYKGFLYRKGALVTGKECYVVTKNFIYKIATDGSATKYIKNANSTEKYEYVAQNIYGKRYLFRVAKNTGKAYRVKKDPNRFGNYSFYTKYYKYRVSYKTGEIKSSKSDTKLREKVVKKAKKYLGYNEEGRDGKSHMVIINYYNRHKPLPRAYAVQKRDAWCATYVSVIFMKTKLIDIFPRECSCQQQINMWQQMGRWKENDAYKPMPGDIIYYDWEDRGEGNNRGTPDHVGIVTKVTSKGRITVIEGNRDDQVCYRVIHVNDRYIRGYGLPEYVKKL